MIPGPSITRWGISRPWPTRRAIEQDLLLARMIVAIYEHPVLREELTFRGGTCLHKIHLPRAWRYSEDLDFVRRTHGGIGPILDALRDVGTAVGLAVQGTKIGEHPRIVFRAQAEDDPSTRLRLKVEINTYETSPARRLIRLPFSVESDWFTGAAEILTFAPEELMATKLRALYQRKKGRDLFDLWLALTEMALPPEEILEGFAPYRPDGYTAETAIVNLEDKLADRLFRADLETLVGEWPDSYDIDSAANLVGAKLLSCI